ncbi:MAG: hypothetical protein R6V58_12340, partial [Planctomycetota bacterium]
KGGAIYIQMFHKSNKFTNIFFYLYVSVFSNKKILYPPGRSAPGGRRLQAASERAEADRYVSPDAITRIR